MKDVYDNRAQKVEYTKKFNSEKRWLSDYEKKQASDEIAKQQREDEEARIRAALAKKEHQGGVLMQIGERDRQQRRDLQEKMYEERAAKLAEIDYTRKIGQEKQVNTNTLNQWRDALGRNM